MTKTPATAPSVVAKALADLNEVANPPLRPEDLPLVPMFWQIAIEPVEPRKESTGEHGVAIALPEDVQQAEEIVCQYGRIVAMGCMAFRSKTASGLDLSQQNPMPKIGDIVSHQQFAGEVHRLRNGKKVRLITETEITALITDLDQIRIYT